MFALKQTRQGVSKRLSFVIAGFGVERNIDLQALRPRGLGKTLQVEVLENRAQPDCDLAALHDVRGRAGVEIENHHSRTFNIVRERKRRMQFDGGQVSDPDQRRQIVSENVIDIALVAFAPNGRGLYPIGAMLGSILFEERHLINAVWISFQCQRLSGKMRDHDRRNARVVIDHLAFGETSSWI